MLLTIQEKNGVTARIVQYSLQLLDVHSPKHFILITTFNRNRNKRIINNHNINILQENIKIKDGGKCRIKNKFPLGGKCLSSSIV